MAISAANEKSNLLTVKLTTLLKTNVPPVTPGTTSRLLMERLTVLLTLLELSSVVHISLTPPTDLLVLLVKLTII